MNAQAMNSSRRHRGCDHTRPYHGDYWIYFPFESSDVLAAASWDQAADHRRDPFFACFRIQFELNIFNILTVSAQPSTHCLELVGASSPNCLDASSSTRAQA
jgi:hypothetical protein